MREQCSHMASKEISTNLNFNVQCHLAASCIPAELSRNRTGCPGDAGSSINSMLYSRMQ